MKITLACVAAAASAVVATPAAACSSCGCTLTADWLSQGLSAQPGTTFGLRYEDVPQTVLRSDTQAVDRAAIALPTDREIERYTYNHYVTLSVDHQIDARWGVDIELPFVYRPHVTVAQGDSDTSQSRTGGIGDLRIGVRRQFAAANGATGLQLGVKLPTGAFDQRFGSGPAADSVVDRGLQPGSGTTDVTLGAYRFGTIRPKLGYFLQGQVQIPLDSRDLYRPGIAATMAAGLQYTGWRGIVPQLQVDARTAGRDRGANSDHDNSGGTQVYVAPGLTVPVSARLSAFGFGQLPLYQRVGGYQLTPRYTLSFGINYRL